MLYQYRPLDLAIHRFNQRFLRDIASYARHNITVKSMDVVETLRDGKQRIKLKVVVDRHAGLTSTEIMNLGSVRRTVEKTVYTVRNTLAEVLSTVVPCDERGRFALPFVQSQNAKMIICQKLNSLGLMFTPSELQVKQLSSDSYLLTAQHSLIAHGNAYLYRDGSIRIDGSDRLCDHRFGVEVDPQGFWANGEEGFLDKPQHCGFVTRYQLHQFDQQPTFLLDDVAYEAHVQISLVSMFEHSMVHDPSDFMAQAIHVKLIPRGAQIYVQGMLVRTIHFPRGTALNVNLLPQSLVLRFLVPNEASIEHTINLGITWQQEYNLVVTAKRGFEGKVQMAGVINPALLESEPAAPRLQLCPMVWGDTNHHIERLVNKNLWKNSIPINSPYTMSTLYGNQMRCVFTGDNGPIGQVDFHQPEILDVLRDAANDRGVHFDPKVIYLTFAMAEPPRTLSALVDRLNDQFGTPFVVTDFESTADVLKQRGVIWCNSRSGQYRGGFRFQSIAPQL